MRVREEFREFSYLMPDEIPPYLDACDPDFRDLAEVLALAGLRISEALALEPRDIDVDGRIINVVRSLKADAKGHLKDKTPRGVEIGPRLAERLEHPKSTHADKPVNGSSSPTPTVATSIAPGSPGAGTSPPFATPGSRCTCVSTICAIPQQPPG